MHFEDWKLATFQGFYFFSQVTRYPYIGQKIPEKERTILRYPRKQLCAKKLKNASTTLTDLGKNSVSEIDKWSPKDLPSHPGLHRHFVFWHYLEHISFHIRRPNAPASSGEGGSSSTANGSAEGRRHMIYSDALCRTWGHKNPLNFSEMKMI